jgi:glutamate/tyrosine decarboxylase-like PLP-dependent enzyme
LHVDGAYGALAAIAAPEKFRGLALADSLSLDPHKWLYQPLDCGCLLYRDPAAARAAFSHTGDYARSLSDDPIEGSSSEETAELSRRFRALAWLSIRYHGMAAPAILSRGLDLAQHCPGDRNAADLELLAPAALSAVCFRYRGRAPDLHIGSSAATTQPDSDVAFDPSDGSRPAESADPREDHPARPGLHLECDDRRTVRPARLHHEPPEHGRRRRDDRRGDTRRRG